MNERIKELMRLSMVSDGREGLGGPHLELDPEKFAELVVQECKFQIADVRIENNFEPVSDAALVKALVGINEHFGVKE